MVLTKPELVAALQTEVRILLHLANKVDRTRLDYRPTPKQRSTIELLRYQTMMGPALVRVIKAADADIWTQAEQNAEALDYDRALVAIAAQSHTYAALLGDMSDTDLRAEIELWGDRATRGVFIVNLVLCGCAAYRTQLFLYLKACGRDELGSSNLWSGIDASVPA